MKELESEAIKLLESNGITGFQTDWGVCGLVNGIKLEWNTRDSCLKVGWGNSDDDLAAIKSSLKKANLTFGGKKYPVIKEVTLQNYESLIEWAKNFEEAIASPAVQRDVYGKIEKPDLGTLCVSNLIAKRVKYAVDNQDPGVLIRDLMDSVDGQITIAQSVNYKNGNGPRYREHAVPCDLIYREAVAMYERGAELYEISAMIKQYLLIVLITPEEAHLLDTQLGLKTEMPIGWKLGHCPFARFSFAGIELTNL